MARPSPNTAYTRSSTLTTRSKVLVSRLGCTSIRRPARQHHGQPITRFLLHRRFSGGQPLRHKPTNRRNWSAPSLPTPLFQMAIQSPEAQTSTQANSLRRMPLLMNSATNCWTSARVRRLGAENSVFAVIRTLQHRPRHPNRCVGQTLTGSHVLTLCPKHAGRIRKLRMVSSIHAPLQLDYRPRNIRKIKRPRLNRLLGQRPFFAKLHDTLTEVRRRVRRAAFAHESSPGLHETTLSR